MTLILPLAFFQFGSLAMLFWGLAALLPLLIHLWSRRRYREESWAAMTFLLAALRKNSRRIQIEQLLLLAVRIALMVLFALALADPLSLIGGWVGGSSSGQTHLVLVLDSSYSMGYVAGVQSRFEAAKALAKELVQSSTQGDGFTLVRLGEPPRAVIAQPAFDPRDALEELDNLELSHAGASLPATLAEVETVLRRAQESHPRLARRRVVVLTDLQQTTWAEVESADVRQRLARLEELAALEIVDLGQPGEQNLSVTNVQIDQRLIAAGASVRIQADLTSHAREDRLRQPVEILVDGQRIADERVDLPAGGSASVAAQHKFDAAGEHVVEVRLADDALPIDNHRWLSTIVRDAIRVLAIGGRPGETNHLALALQPSREGQGQFDIVEAPESRLLEGELQQFDCIFLCNIGRFSADEAGVLSRYVRRGGGLVFFLGDQVQAESYNQVLLDDAATRLLPGRLGALAPTESYALNPLEYRHPIVAPFRGHEQSGLLTTPVWKYVRLEPSPRAKVALGLSTGDPLIVEESVGRGRCVLVATAVSPASLDSGTNPPTPWTAISSWPSFPPLVHEILQYAVAGRAEGRNLLVGEELAGLVPPGALHEALTLSGPGGLNERVPVVAEGSETRWTFGGTSVSGVYEARAGKSLQRFAVNVNPREGDLARYDAELLPPQFHREGIPAGAPPTSYSGGNSQSYFRWLLGAVLALLFIEAALAWQMGRGRG
jgi:hypothetical protein